MIRKIEAIYPPPKYHWVGNGFRVHNFFPGNTDMQMTRMSPFFVMDYASKHEFPPSETPRGVDVHPHRGIETVTIAYHGKIAHHDSTGNSGVISEGDVQWMTAGSGILHKEYHEKEFNSKGGTFQMVQLWVNLAAKDKMTAPKYQDLLFRDANKFMLDDNGGYINVIAGEYKNIKGKAETFTPINLFDCFLKSTNEIDFKFYENYNTGFLVVEGKVLINGETEVNQDHFILFENIGDEISVKAISDAKVLVLNGEPINEPIVPYGPFVMNTREEIEQAIKDYRDGKFGHLE
jgi:redox-sensitive bicupin YhaK (pirin superfamily)